MHSEPSSFVTLTYDDDHYKVGLEYGDFQRFMRSFRYRVGPTRFFVVGEYGDINLRPHFHAVLFGRTFTDGKAVGKDLYSSPALSNHWPHGISSYGSVTYESASYVAGYCLKKVLGNSDESELLRGRRYSRVDLHTGELVSVPPEFARMSLKPGIGASWFAKYWREVFGVRDGCVLKGGRSVPAPKFYDRLLDSLDPSLKEGLDFSRFVRAEAFASDNTPERLRVKELCAIARSNFYSKRSL